MVRSIDGLEVLCVLSHKKTVNSIFPATKGISSIINPGSKKSGTISGAWIRCILFFLQSVQRKKQKKYAKQYEAVIVLGCDSATEAVRDLVKSSKVIEGMEVAGFMNAKLKFRLPCNVSFEDCKIIPMSQRMKNEEMSADLAPTDGA